MTGSEDASRSKSLEAPNRAKPGFEPAMVSLNRIVRVLLSDMKSTRDELVEDPGLDRPPIRGDFNGDCSTAECPAEEPLAAFRSRFI